MNQKSVSFWRHLNILLVGALMLSGCTSKIEGDREQRSYSVGFALGQQLASVKDDLDPNFVARGVKDGIEKAAKLDNELMSRRLGELNLKQREREANGAADNLKKSQEFIAAALAKKGVRVLETGILVEETKAGTGLPHAIKDDEEIVVRYVAKRMDGSVFDQTSDSNGVKLHYKDLALPGLKKAIQKMQVGSEWTVYMAPEHAYGPRAMPGIPGQSALVYELALLRVGAKKATVKAEAKPESKPEPKADATKVGSGKSSP